MTSRLASNAIVPTNSTRKHSLAATKDGEPLNRQVPRTLQVYSGVGGVTIDYDGSDDVLVLTSSFTGNLTIRFGPTAREIRNNLGREIKIHIPEATTRTITLDTSPAFMRLNGTNLTQLSHVIPGDLISKTITLSPTNVALWNLDYGSAVNSLNPFPLLAHSSTVSVLYKALATTAISGLVRFGVPPYTYGGPLTTDPRHGSVVVSGSNIVFYPPTRNFSPLFSVPITMTDSVGSTVRSTFYIVNDMLTSSIFGSLSYTVPRVTYVGDISGENGVWCKPDTVDAQLLRGHGWIIYCLAMNQNDGLMFWVDENNLTFYFDRVRNTSNPIQITFSPTLASAGVGVVNAISYRHDTDELYMFGETVTKPVVVVKFKPYQRITSGPSPALVTESITFLESAVDPNVQEALVGIYDATSYVTSCEFVDGTDLMMISVWDPVATRSKLVTLNSAMFCNRGSTTGTTTHDQYVIGSYNNAALDAIHVSLFSYKVEYIYYLCLLDGTAGSYVAIRDYSFNANTLTTIAGIGASGIIGLPTEVRATRNLLNY